MPATALSLQNYHYGSAASADGVHWHSYSDMSMQIDARADTLNNVIYDRDSNVRSFPFPCDEVSS